MSELKDMIYISEDVGGTFKSSKHQYIWEFTLDDKRISIQFFISKLSNKRKIIYNQKVIREEECKENIYSYEFIKDGHNFKVTQTMNMSDLLIDGESFEHFYILEKSKKEFYGEQKSNINSIVTNEGNNDDQSNIQRSNEINFIKQEKPKQILNFSFKKNNNLYKENNLNKFKFNSSESHSNKADYNNLNSNNNQKYEQNNNRKVNLIDFDNDFNDDNNGLNNNNYQNQFQNNMPNNMRNNDYMPNIDYNNYSDNNSFNNNRNNYNDFNNMNTNNNFIIHIIINKIIICIHII